MMCVLIRHTECPRRQRTRCGFTLVEVLIVVVLLSILAASIIPHALESTRIADESTVRHDLREIRSAIQRYRADHEGQLPAQDKKNDTLKLELKPYLLNGFPENPFGDNGKKAAEVDIKKDGNPLINHVGGDKGWLYNNATGEFILNSAELSTDGTTRYCEF